MFQNLFHLTNFLLVVVSVIVCCSDGVKSQKSPCPRVFEYKYDDYKIYGIVRLPGVIGTNHLKIKFALGQAPNQTKSAVIKILDSDVEIKRKLGTGGNIKYKIDFPSGITSIPQILSIILNNEEYCANNLDGTTYSEIQMVQLKMELNSPVGDKRTLRQRRQYDNITNFNPGHKWGLSWMDFKYHNICGRTETHAFHKINNERKVAPHEFPWLAALLDNKGKFYCGGSLVSDRHVITAARCTVSNRLVYVELGKHNLEDRREDGVESRFPQNIVNHPEYKPTGGHADISVIILSEKVSFSDQIKPICLWSFVGNDIDLLGTVVDWDKDRRLEGTYELTADDVTIISDTECRNSDRLFEFATIISNTTFCAGGKSKGPRVGDVGSPFMVQNGKRWFLKGILSLFLGSRPRYRYAWIPFVYCDVNEYLQWLKDILEPENKETDADPDALITTILPPSTMKVQDNWLKSFKFNNICGTKKALATHTVIEGRDVVPHEFPWLAVLLNDKGGSFCGGSLVSDRHVISAAHCTVNKQWVVVELGKHNLETKNEDGVALRFSRNIVNHPEYKPNTAHADISIITLPEEVTFSDKINPICLWPSYETPVGFIGTIAGWGIDRSGEDTNTPMAADVAIVSDTECRDSDPLFVNITSETTFCAGGKSKGPCLGDSGSGFVLERDNRWYLKGITSTSVKTRSRGCNVNKPAVYCDVGKYLGWLKTFLLSE